MPDGFESAEPRQAAKCIQCRVGDPSLLGYEAVWRGSGLNSELYELLQVRDLVVWWSCAWWMISVISADHCCDGVCKSGLVFLVHESSVDSGSALRLGWCSVSKYEVVNKRAVIAGVQCGEAVPIQWFAFHCAPEGALRANHEVDLMDRFEELFVCLAPCGNDGREVRVICCDGL
eukprot:6489255-Amphidinium_carterae.2